MADSLAEAARQYLQAQFDVLRTEAEKKAGPRLRAAARLHLSAALPWFMLGLLAVALRLSSMADDAVLSYYFLVVSVLSFWKVLTTLVDWASMRSSELPSPPRKLRSSCEHKLKRVK